MAELLLTLTIGFATDVSDDAGLQSYVTKKLNHIKSKSFPYKYIRVLCVLNRYFVFSNLLNLPCK